MKKGGENFCGFLMFYFPLTKIDDYLKKKMHSIRIHTARIQGIFVIVLPNAT